MRAPQSVIAGKHSGTERAATMRGNVAAPLALRIPVPDFRFVLDCGPSSWRAHFLAPAWSEPYCLRAPLVGSRDRDAANGNPCGMHTLDVCPRTIRFVCLAKQ